MDRTPEPELMEGQAQARAYAGADFEAPNTAFVREVEAAWGEVPEVLRAIDLGCGPADIPVRLARRHPGWHIDAVDGSEAMLAHGREAVRKARLEDRIRLVNANLGDLADGDLEAAGLGQAAYDAALSNSLLHHLHDPTILWKAVRRLARPGARVVVMDLCRPATRHQARRLVDQHAAGEPDVLRTDFENSLCAAFTVAEVRAQLEDAGLDGLTVEQTTDRHLVVRGHLPKPL